MFILFLFWGGVNLSQAAGRCFTMRLTDIFLLLMLWKCEGTRVAGESDLEAT